MLIAPYVEIDDHTGNVTLAGESRGHIASARRDSRVIDEAWNAWLSDRPLPAGWAREVVEHLAAARRPDFGVAPSIDSLDVLGRFGQAMAYDPESARECIDSLMGDAA